ncbi:hypothetical protein N6H14_14485 [Paenibacillus sp. CC-CFT747]|nr:hypothetical protein N6H14_14485 [Paenibacillus sp. CC-CFT747]
MKPLHFDFPMREQVYKEAGRELKLYLFEPDEPSSAGRPVLLFFNGGSFKKEPKLTPVQFQHQARYFAERECSRSVWITATEATKASLPCKPSRM